MTRDEAIAFLQAHQPMPDDMPTDLWMQYWEVIEYFAEHPDPACIPLFLNSIGDGDGRGAYVELEAAFTALHPEEVVPHLIRALRHPRRATRYWAADIAMRFPVSDLVEPLSEILAGPDLDSRFAATTALAFINDPRVDGILAAALEREPDDDLHEHLNMAIDDRRESLRGMGAGAVPVEHSRPLLCPKSSGTE